MRRVQPLEHRQIAVIGHRLGHIRGKRGAVDRRRAQRRHACLLVWQHLEGNFIQIGQVLVPEIGIARVDNAIVRHKLDQFVRSGAYPLGQHVDLVVDAPRCDRGIALPGEIADHARIGPAHVDADRIFVDRVDRGDLGWVLRLDTGRRRIGLRLDAPLDVFGGDLAAIMELDALAQLEDVGVIVWRGPLGRQRGLDRQVAVPGNHGVIHELLAPHVRRGHCPIGDQVDRVLLERPGDLAALLAAGCRRGGWSRG